jgi:hypothetical protein
LTRPFRQRMAAHNRSNRDHSISKNALTISHRGKMAHNGRTPAQIPGLSKMTVKNARPEPPCATRISRTLRRIRPCVRLSLRTRISCLAALDGAACAAFIKESRMEPATANNTNRKSGKAA